MTSILALPNVPFSGLTRTQPQVAVNADQRPPVPCLGLALVLSAGLWLPIGYAAIRLFV